MQSRENEMQSRENEMQSRENVINCYFCKKFNLLQIYNNEYIIPKNVMEIISNNYLYY